MKTILTTKTLSINEKSLLGKQSLRLIEHNFITTELLPFTLSLPYQLLIFTSQNAVKSALQHPEAAALKQIPAICVGESTCKLLRTHGFSVQHFAPYAAELISYMKANLAHYRTLHIAFLAGSHRLDTLPHFLQKENITFSEITVYRTLLTPITIHEKLDAILFFSPSGVESYCKCNTPKGETVYCIGTTTAQAAARYWQHIVIAPSPTTQSLMSTLANEQM